MEFVNKSIPKWATLDAVLGVLLDTGNPTCREYPLLGVRLLGDRELLFEDYMNELRDLNRGHWHIGMRSLGVMGKSQDVSRYCFFEREERRRGQPTFTNDDGVNWSPAPQLAERPDGSGASFMLSEENKCHS